jgi:hypothetical protein
MSLFPFNTKSTIKGGITVTPLANPSFIVEAMANPPSRSCPYIRRCSKEVSLRPFWVSA